MARSLCLLCFWAPKELLLQGVTSFKMMFNIPLIHKGHSPFCMFSWQASAQHVDMGAGEQRTAEWHAERDKRLTASAFGNALGYDTSVCLCHF